MTLTDLQRDILVKAAEGIQEGMWCQGSSFIDTNGRGLAVTALLLNDGLTLEEATRSQRCVQGEIAIATTLLGGDRRDYADALYAVTQALLCPIAHRYAFHHNDECMAGLDAFSAGQEWARIFREVAES